MQRRGGFGVSMMAIFRHLRSVHVHRDMGTYGAGGRLGCGEDPIHVEVMS